MINELENNQDKENVEQQKKENVDVKNGLNEKSTDPPKEAEPITESAIEIIRPFGKSDNSF